MQIGIWEFIAERLRIGERVMLLVVAESSGSSPGRAGYKMAVGEDGDLVGSIGGGVMEVNLVERAKQMLAETSTPQDAETTAELIVQEHRKDSPCASGMICSGKQTVIIKKLTSTHLQVVQNIASAIDSDGGDILIINESAMVSGPGWCGTSRLEPGGDGPITFEKDDDTFTYVEHLGRLNHIYIIGGGHCALALSGLMSKLGFRISIFDDRPSLNTLEKNEFAQTITIVHSYDEIAAHIPEGDEIYVVVMTLGYASDAIVIKQLIGHDVKYLGVLGSRAKMKTLMKELGTDGVSAERLAQIHTPIGLAINSRTPEEIAVSIAAEIISVKNAD